MQSQVFKLLGIRQEFFLALDHFSHTADVLFHIFDILAALNAVFLREETLGHGSCPAADDGLLFLQNYTSMIH